MFIQREGAVKESDKRELILQTALELFAENGFHGVPMTMIAEKAQIAIGTFYIYFRSKETLINELMQEVENRIIGEIEKVSPHDKSIQERFLHYTRALVKHLIDFPLHFRYIEQYMNSPFGISKRRDALIGQPGNSALMFNLFDEGVKNKVLKDLPISALFSLGVGSLIFLIRDHILGFVKLDDDAIDRMTRACWDGIKR